MKMKSNEELEEQFYKVILPDKYDKLVDELDALSKKYEDQKRANAGLKKTIVALKNELRTEKELYKNLLIKFNSKNIETIKEIDKRLDKESGDKVCGTKYPWMTTG